MMLVLLLAGCGTEPTATPAPAAVGTTGTFAAPVAGSDAFLAIASDGKIVLAYFCDGTADHITAATWFKGTLDGQEIALRAADGASLTLRLAGDTATGAITPSGGKDLPFTAPRVTGRAGLYRAEQTVNDSHYVAGWIVLPDDQQRGGAIKDGTSNTIVAPRLPTAAGNAISVRFSDLGDFSAQRMADGSVR